jgi:hypothetical protein
VTEKRYRVAQWGTGHSGMPALRALIEHPTFEFVGVRVYSDAKAGRDAGELCGVGPTGILATTSIDDIIAAKPDCVVYMPVGPDFDDICLLLESGINISTLLEHFHDPQTLDPEVRARIEDACQRGGASIYSSGPSPGFVTESLPLVLTSLERRLDCYRIEEYADMSHRNSPEMFALLGFGGPPDAVDVELIGQGAGVAYGSSLRRLADALSLEFDEVVVNTEVATATKPAETAVGAVEAGTLAAWRIEISGVRDGKPLMQMVPTWYLTTDLEPAWEIPFAGQGWRVKVDGDLPLDVSIRFAWDTPEQSARHGYGNANRPINAVPNVCEAPPGILSTFALPQIVSKLR